MWLNNNKAFWKEIIETAENKKVTCLYCNVWDDTPNLLKQRFESINFEYFKFAFDIGHAHYISTVSIGKWFEELGDYLE